MQDNNDEMVIRSEEFMEKNDISYNDLTDDLKDKYDILDEALNEFDELETDDENIIRDTILAIEAKDSGLLIELEPFYAQLKENRDKMMSQKAQEGQERLQKEQQQNPNASQPQPNQIHDFGDGGKTKLARPSWRFW
jgi:predicted  nucleic acid-binding Zn-ribbon protein